MTRPIAPYASFNGVIFDWGQGQPQKERKNGADYYTGGIVVYYQPDLDQLWALRAVVNVRAVGNGDNRVYIDSWEPLGSIEHTLSMSNGREKHLAILTDLALDQRHWSTVSGGSHADRVPIVVAFAAKAEFLLLN